MNTFTAPFSRFGDGISRFMKLETAAGLVMLGAAILAIVVKNSPLQDAYAAFLNIEGQIRLGAISVEKPLFLWTNDFLMAIFFFMVAMEIKQEAIHGHLSDVKQIVLPAAGAIGGVLVPALIYLWFNSADAEAAKGWAVPTATDIAFALTVLAFAGKGVPTSLKIFLMTLAILDDLFAILIIAFFYTSGLSLQSLAFGGFFLAVLIGLNRFGVRTITPYIIVGIMLWVCVLKSGVHATLAGVVTGLLIPASKGANGENSPLKEVLHDIHPWVAFGILPLFAFVNAGISLEGLSFSRVMEPIPLGIGLGLILGKPLGILLTAAIAVFVFKVSLPAGSNWRQMVGVACLCGIGFTMSLFIGGLAFAEGGAGYARIDRLGILLGSLISAIVGLLILRWASPATGVEEKPVTPAAH